MVKIKNYPVKVKSICLFFTLFVNIFYFNSVSAQEYIVGGDFNYSPFSVIDKKGGDSGVVIDILNAISVENNIDFNFQFNQWSRACKDIQSGKIDIIPGIIYSEGRTELVDCTCPVHSEYYSIFVRKNVQFNDVLNLSAYRLVVLKDYIFFDKYLKLIGIYNNYLVASSFSDALAKIEDGMADFVVAPHFFGIQEIENNKYKNIKIEAPPVIPSIYCSAVKKGDSLLLDVLNQGILNLKGNGELIELQSKWNIIEKGDFKYIKVVKYVEIIIIVIGVSLMFIFVWIWLLRKQNKKKITCLNLKNYELRKSEEKFRIITENSSDIIWHMDSNFRWTYISPADERIRGVKTEAVIGTYLWSILKSEGIELLKKANERRIALEKLGLKSVPVIYEMEQICKDGSWIWVESIVTPCYDQNGEISGYHGITRDISERKKTEQALKESELQLKKSNAEKDKFFTILAHDLKSPFNSIISYSDLLSEQIKNNNIKGVTKYSTIINTSSKKAMNLLSNLMEWSLSQTSIMNFNPKKIDINDIVNENVCLFDDILKHKSLTMTVDIQTNLFGYVDRYMINIVLRNLISNAVKFTANGGCINISGKLKQNKIEISLSDTGIGLSTTVIEKLFQSEEQYITPWTQSGSGLGLILCKEFIERHKERIWVKSELEKGSVFYFTLPCNPI
ncbi:MAG: transporter substrate-binding domain-containing protein [Labilibaculum sp.]|nr:transporter substrate-binding domain-containing protein [Labilibaculum sp.]